MRLARRNLLQLAASFAALPGLSASAETYPSRPVHLIVGFTPGGGVDIIARLMGQWLSGRFRQTFIVENRPGAGSNIATEAVVRAPADGYTLLLAFSANAINATLYGKLNFNFIRDIVPVAGIARVPDVLTVHPSLPVTALPEFIAYAKANPGKLSMASGGNGTPSHVAGELFKLLTGIDMVHVPYRGLAPALADLLGGQVQAMFASMPSAIGHIRSGKLRPLAVTTAARSDQLPDVPTVGDFVPGYEESPWYGIGAPANTPADIVAKLNNEINAGLVDPKIKARLADLGATVLPSSPADFGRLIAEETEKWARVVRFSGAKPD